MAMSPRLLRPIASGFNPKSLSGLFGWWDFSDAATLTLNGAAPTQTISEVRDKSGNNRHFLHTTALNQPAYTPNAQNGRAAATFNGANTFLDIASVTLNQPFTAIGVYLNTATSAFRVLLAGTPSAGSGGFIMFARNPYGNQGMTLGALFAPIPAITDWQVHSNVADGAASVVARNLDADSTGNAGLNSVSTLRMGANHINGAGALQGPVGAVLIYDRVLTRAEREQLVRYLAPQWGITV
jgi:hypothetical protein